MFYPVFTGIDEQHMKNVSQASFNSYCDKHFRNCKIAAHTGNHYNEEADQLAKSALLKTDKEVRI